MIAILGTGLLGTGFAQAAIKRGETVHVWNRTAAKARAIEGAQAFDEPADAVKGASRVHVVVSDDAAVNGVLAKLPAGLTIYDHTTTSTAGARERTARTDVDYLHAPVFMGPQNAREQTGLMLIAGDRAKVDRAKPVLAPMTGKLVELGERVDAAACFKLMGNLFLMAFTAGIADMLGLAKALGIPAAEAATLFDHFNPGASVGARAKRMVDAAFDTPSWELAMARKDARLVAEEVGPKGVELALLPAIAERMDRYLAEGAGALDWTVIARAFVQ
jgi:3-hydroxyisobutyrate dehydrogenase